MEGKSMRFVSSMVLLLLAISARPALTQVTQVPTPPEGSAAARQGRALQEMRFESAGPNLVMISWSPGNGEQSLRLESTGFTVRHEADGTTVRSAAPVTMTGISEGVVRTCVWQSGMTMVVGQDGAVKWFTSSTASR
jgi:hypothetical protein